MKACAVIREIDENIMDTILDQPFIQCEIASIFKKRLDMIIIDKAKCIFVTFYEIVPQ